EVIRDVLKEFLGRDYKVHTVGNAALAMAAIIQHQPDAIVLDIRMPGVDGLSLLKSLREMGVRTPVFVITGYDSTPVAIEALERRATGYLPKPFGLLHLEQLVANTVRSSTA